MGILEEAWEQCYRRDDEKLVVAGLLKQSLRLVVRDAVLASTGDMFYNGTHARIWDAARQLATDSRLMIPDNFRPLLSKGDMMEVERAFGKPVREVEFREGLRLVEDAYRRRQLLDAVKHIAAETTSADDYSQALGSAHESLAVLEGEETASTSTTLQEVLTEFWEEVDNPEFVREVFPTPWPSLNDPYLLGGHQRGHLVTWMAESGGGKSVALLQTAGQYVREGRKVAIFSLEMSRLDVVERLLAATANVRSSQIITRDVGSAREQLETATQLLNNPDVHIFDAADLTIQAIRQQCAVLKRTSGLDVVVIDYIQRVPPPDNVGNRESEVAQIVRGMKTLAMALNVVVLTASQMNKVSDTPSKGSARESQAIIHESDVVLALKHGSPGEVDIVGVKNRRGSEFDGLMCLWNAHVSRIDDPTAR